MNKEDIRDWINRCDDLGFDKYRNEFYFCEKTCPMEYTYHFVGKDDLEVLHLGLPSLINSLLHSGRQYKAMDLRLTLDYWHSPEDFIVLPGNHYRTLPTEASISKRVRSCFVLVSQQFNVVKLPNGNTMAQGRYPETYLQDRHWMEKYYPGAAAKIEQLESLGCTDPVEIASMVFVGTTPTVENANLEAVTFS